MHAGAIDPNANETSSSIAVEPRPRTLGWVVGGLGVAGIGTGVVTGLMLTSKRSAAESACPTRCARAKPISTRLRRAKPC